jgi:hypothetical protein
MAENVILQTLSKLSPFTKQGKLAVLKHSGHYMYGRFNTHKFYVLPPQLYLCVLCGSRNKQPLFPYTTLTDWFV